MVRIIRRKLKAGMRQQKGPGTMQKCWSQRGLTYFYTIRISARTSLVPWAQDVTERVETPRIAGLSRVKRPLQPLRTTASLTDRRQVGRETVEAREWKARTDWSGPGNTCTQKLDSVCSTDLDFINIPARVTRDGVLRRSLYIRHVRSNGARTPDGEFRRSWDTTK